MRDDFPAQTKNVLARRVGMRCSNPNCRKPTTGPRDNPEKSVTIGIACHISAASSGGPRYDQNLSTMERKSIENGIWLYQNCAKLIDNDGDRFTVAVLRAWKHLAEETARMQLETTASTENDFSAPKSVYELITLVDLRANNVLNEMNSRKENAVKLFRRNQLTRAEDLRDYNAVLSCELSDDDSVAAFARLLMHDFRDWQFDSEDKLCSALDSMIRKFVELHDRHKHELIRGNYVSAHEIVGQIHTIIRNYERATNPPLSRSPSGMLYYRDLIGPRVRQYEKYPGFISTKLMRKLSQDLCQYYLVEGEEAKNRARVTKWLFPS